MQLLHYLENDLESGTCSSENLVIKIVVLKCFGLFNMAKLMCDLEGWKYRHKKRASDIYPGGEMSY